MCVCVYASVYIWISLSLLGLLGFTAVVVIVFCLLLFVMTVGHGAGAEV